MNKGYFFKSVVHVLVFSLLNLQFSSIAYGMKGQTASVDEDYIGKNGGSAIRLSELRKTDTLTQPILDQHTAATSHALPKEEVKESFKFVLRSFVEKFHNEEDRSQSMRWITRCVAGGWAAIASLALYSLFLVDGSTQSFLEYPIDDDAYVTIPPVTRAAIAIGVVAAVLSLADQYLLSSHALKGGYAPFKNHHLIEEQDSLKKIGFYTLACPTIAILMAQMLYAYITNAVGPETDSMYALGNRGLQIAVGIPFFALQFLKDYRSFAVNYRLLYEGARKKIDKARGIKHKGEEEKTAIRTRLAHDLRKVLKDPEKTKDLHHSLQTLQETVRTKRLSLTERLAALKGTQKEEERNAHQPQIADLEAQLKDLEAQGALVFMKHLYTFDQNEEYKPGKVHPWWFYTARGAGIVLGGLASEAVWYGMVLVTNDFGLSDAASYRLGTVASLVTIPYLMDRARFWLESTTSLFNHYNPVENQRTISSPIVDFSRLNKIMSPFNMAKSTFLLLPVAMVGGDGMGLGIGPGAPSILWRNQLRTIIPSMLCWGAAENKNTGPRLLGGISRTAEYLGLHDKVMTERQEVADWFHRLDRWVEKLAGHHVPELKELLDRHHEDIETGKHALLGGHKDDSQGSTDSPSSDEKRNSSDDSGGSHKGSPEDMTLGGGEMKTGDLDSVRRVLLPGEAGSGTITTANPLHKEGGLHTTTDSDDDM